MIDNVRIPFIHVIAPGGTAVSNNVFVFLISEKHRRNFTKQLPRRKRSAGYKKILLTGNIASVLTLYFFINNAKFKISPQKWPEF